MSQSDNHFEEFKPHSKHKHLILKYYFESWGHKLGLRRDSSDQILYVDACAGRGKDDLGNDGSPLIASKSAAVASESVRRHKNGPFRIKVVAIEKKRKHFEALRDLLAPFGEDVRAIKGTLGGTIEQIEQDFRDSPTLFFIDPFGLEPLDANVVKRALSGERNEALILFADQAALRHFGAVATIETRAEIRHKKAAEALESTPSLFPQLEKERRNEVSKLADAAEASREHLAITQENAERILCAAFGDMSWKEEIEKLPKSERRGRFITLYCDLLRRFGAQYLLPIPIVSEDGTHAYTLIYATKSKHGYRAMKEAVTYALNNSPLPSPVVERMQDMLRSDPKELAEMAVDAFAGQRVKWAEDKHDKTNPSVRMFLLEATSAFPFDLDNVKEQLRKYRMPGRAIEYEFPPQNQAIDQDN